MATKSRSEQRIRHTHSKQATLHTASFRRSEIDRIAGLILNRKHKIGLREQVSTDDGT